MTGARRAIVAVAVVLSVFGSVWSTPGSAAPTWAPAATATIHPGVQVVSPAGQCTANFVFYDQRDVYLGQAAHCTSDGEVTDLVGCDTPSLPLGTPIAIQGASKPGVLAYNSWRTMRAVGETDADACAFNDLALVRIDPADVGKVNPSVPHWGGPTGLSTGTALGQAVYSYGNSRLRLGLALLSPKSGVSLGDTNHGWNHATFTVTPGIPGDSGSAFLDAGGRALGVLSAIVVAPLAGANEVGDLRRELAYLHSHVSKDVELALGTEPFNPSQLPLGL